MGAALSYLPQQRTREVWCPANPLRQDVLSTSIRRMSSAAALSSQQPRYAYDGDDDEHGDAHITVHPLYHATKTYIAEWLHAVPLELSELVPVIDKDDCDDVVDGDGVDDRRTSRNSRKDSEGDRKQSVLPMSVSVTFLTAYRLQVHNQSYPLNAEISCRCCGSTSVNGSVKKGLRVGSPSGGGATMLAPLDGVRAMSLGSNNNHNHLGGNSDKDDEWMYNLDALDQEYQRKSKKR